jgi:hypothetical protein
MAMASELLPLAVGPTMVITGCSDVMINGRAAMTFFIRQSDLINGGGIVLQAQ